MKLLLIILTLFLIVVFITLVIKCFLNSLFFAPKLYFNEVINILEENNCIYINHRYIKHKEKFQLKDISINSSEYHLEGLSIEDKLRRVYSVKIITYNSLTRKRKIIVNEIS